MHSGEFNPWTYGERVRGCYNPSFPACVYSSHLFVPLPKTSRSQRHEKNIEIEFGNKNKMELEKL